MGFHHAAATATGKHRHSMSTMCRAFKSVHINDLKAVGGVGVVVVVGVIIGVVGVYHKYSRID